MRPDTQAPDAKDRAARLRFLFLPAVACLSVALVGPPRAVPEMAPPTDFSSGRAMRHVREMTRAPHPSGTAENERVRAYLLAELRALGLEPEVQAAEFVPRQRAGGFPSAGDSQRRARVKGTESSRRSCSPRTRLRATGRARPYDGGRRRLSNPPRLKSRARRSKTTSSPRHGGEELALIGTPSPRSPVDEEFDRPPSRAGAGCPS